MQQLVSTVVQSKEGNQHETRKFYEKWTIKGIHHNHQLRIDIRHNIAL